MRRYKAYLTYCSQHGTRPCQREYEEKKWMKEEK
jgi:hypothetical protein